MESCIGMGSFLPRCEEFNGNCGCARGPGALRVGLRAYIAQVRAAIGAREASWKACEAAGRGFLEHLPFERAETAAREELVAAIVAAPWGPQANGLFLATSRGYSGLHYTVYEGRMRVAQVCPSGSLTLFERAAEKARLATIRAQRSEAQKAYLARREEMRVARAEGRPVEYRQGQKGGACRLRSWPAGVWVSIRGSESTPSEYEEALATMYPEVLLRERRELRAGAR